MSTHAARIETSDRLQRVDKLLADGREYSTREIVQHCDVYAVNSIIAELRSNGRDIRCRRERNVWLYRRAGV